MKIATLTEIVVNMQASLNRMDTDKRNMNIIVSGMPEGDMECGQDILLDYTEKFPGTTFFHL